MVHLTPVGLAHVRLVHYAILTDVIYIIIWILLRPSFGQFIKFLTAHRAVFYLQEKT